MQILRSRAHFICVVSVVCLEQEVKALRTELVTQCEEQDVELLGRDGSLVGESAEVKLANESVDSSAGLKRRLQVQELTVGVLAEAYEKEVQATDVVAAA